jgi:hypothetical protein
MLMAESALPSYIGHGLPFISPRQGVIFPSIDQASGVERAFLESIPCFTVRMTMGANLVPWGLETYATDRQMHRWGVQGQISIGAN